MIIYVAGNLLVEKDSLPLKLLPKLKSRFPNIEFVEFDPTEEFPEDKNMVILDAALGISDVKIIDDLNALVIEKKYSLHDFDLATNLKLMKKMGTIQDVKIICVPAGMAEEEAFEKVAGKIKSMI